MNQRQVEQTIIQVLEEFVSKAQQNNKADTPQIVIREVLSWTKGQLHLTKKLCHIILLGTSIPTDEEERRVKQLAQKHLIENWETQDDAKHLQQMRDRILQNKDCDPFWLLVQYQQVLQKQKLAEDSPEVQELLKLKLVIKQNGQLQVHNPIYEEVFKLDWVEKKLSDLCPYANKLAAWKLSNCQDESYLLLGQELQEALESTRGRILNKQEDKFLISSQVLNLRGD